MIPSGYRVHWATHILMCAMYSVFSCTGLSIGICQRITDVASVRLYVGTCAVSLVPSNREVD